MPDHRHFRLEVTIPHGPIPEISSSESRVITRIIQIRGDHTLRDLHGAIFDAFEREEERVYEFQLGGRGPMDPAARRYVLPENLKDGSDPSGEVTGIRVGDLGLTPGDTFGYCFDFGHDWWHRIEVTAILERAPRDRFPKAGPRVRKFPSPSLTLVRKS